MLFAPPRLPSNKELSSVEDVPCSMQAESLTLLRERTVSKILVSRSSKKQSVFLARPFPTMQASRGSPLLSVSSQVPIPTSGLTLIRENLLI